MKKLIATIATVVFAGSVHAALDSEVYHGWAAGNPDLSSGVVTVKSDVSPGSYDAIVYNGFQQGNSELSFGSESVAVQLAVQPGIGDSFDTMDRSSLSSSSVYNGFEIGNPDL